MLSGSPSGTLTGPTSPWSWWAGRKPGKREGDQPQSHARGRSPVVQGKVTGPRGGEASCPAVVQVPAVVTSLMDCCWVMK